MGIPVLTHWGRVTHIWVSKLTIIGSDNGLSPDRRQAIIWTNAGILSIDLLGTKLSEISIAIHIFIQENASENVVWKMAAILSRPQCVNTLRPRQNGHHFMDNIFKCIFLNENILILIQISLKFIPKVPINNIPALVQIIAWRRPGDKPLYELMMIILLTHICVTLPQWDKDYVHSHNTIVCL